MQRKTLCALLSLVFATTLSAQDAGTIKGSVIDASTDHPLEFVNVVLRTKIDSTIVTGAVTDKAGRFECTDVPWGKYFVTFSLIGYVEKTTPAFAIDSLHRHLNV